jgi:hypothetical protein
MTGSTDILENTLAVRTLRERWAACAEAKAGIPLTDEDLERFLVARDWDVEKALVMLRANAQWRADTFPIERTPAIDAILESKRVGEVVGWTSDDSPVLVFDCMWGKLLSGVSESDFLNAYILFIEDVLKQMAERGSQSNFSWILLGGPPPRSIIRFLTTVFEANYPERLRKVVIAPVPATVKSFVDGMLRFLPSRTKSKFALAANSQTLADALDVKVSAFPQYLQNVEGFEAERMKLGIATSSTLDDGSEQSIRSMYVGAGESLTAPFEVTSKMTNVEFSVDVRGKGSVPGIGTMMGLVSTQDVKVQIRFVPANTSPEEADEVVLSTERVPDLNYVWVNTDKREGTLYTTINNEHSARMRKLAQLVQIGRVDEYKYTIDRRRTA